LKNTTKQTKERLERFKELYSAAVIAADSTRERLTRHMDQYLGSDEIDGSSERASVVRNITYEIIESVPVIVVKKDKSREVFDRNKLFNGLLRACEKRPVSLESIEHAVDQIEATLQNSLDREVTSVHIGEMVMDKLKGVDEVAYVRFASVYRQFKDINTFMDELAKLLSEK
jgi:transcriptional repressor NrdR